jgi:uncharacterized small protein (DUF1192 family)
MDFDEPVRRPADDPLERLGAEDLDRLSVDDLDRRIRLLEAEIERTRRRRAETADVRGAADRLFGGR